MIKKVLYTPLKSSYTKDRFMEYNLFHMLGDKFITQYIQAEESIIYAKNEAINNVIKHTELKPVLNTLLCGLSIKNDNIVLTVDV